MTDSFQNIKGKIVNPTLKSQLELKVRQKCDCPPPPPKQKKIMCELEGLHANIPPYFCWKKKVMCGARGLHVNNLNCQHFIFTFFFFKKNDSR